MKKLFFLLFGTAMTLASLFFAYYTMRLLWLNLTMPDAAAHRSTGMYIGMVVFPTATIIFGVISWLSFKFMRKVK